MTTLVASVELQGHRGARGVLPENSIPGFQNAIAAGADCLELDIAMTRDGRVVITHDPVLNPDLVRKDGLWITEELPVKDLTYEELRSYDIGRLRPGSSYAQNFPEQQPIDGISMPLLSDLLNLPAARDKTSLLYDIEIKTSPEAEDMTFSPARIADAVIKTIDEAGARKRSRIRSFDWRGLVHVRESAPDIALAFLTSKQPWLDNLQIGQEGGAPWLAGLDIDAFDGSAPRAMHHFNGQIWAPYYKEVTKQEINVAHELGINVIVWTVNDEDAMQKLLAMGVDGITTDYPALGRKVIDEFLASQKDYERR